MRERIVALLTEAGFRLVDTNRWGWCGELNTVFRIGYASNEWTVSYQTNDEPEVRRWRLTTNPQKDSVPQDLLSLIAEWVDAFRSEGAQTRI